jgi:hypothetical protein
MTGLLFFGIAASHCGEPSYLDLDHTCHFYGSSPLRHFDRSGCEMMG